ncbi:L,D-transpeptidase [Psychromarinibacter halotolerans]|uniref:L,D-transpeptidase n=1 Tax=Psychromarinibacter halotolerans TaxID=1775175 RepID=A0ABV7GPS3_9RHOB|nr:L,D-transpeptidase [Psychromarinibacter halotolerans]MDF0595577.1 L,D-transpeptidase [Psychromarinibacter halotolerans]
MVSRRTFLASGSASLAALAAAPAFAQETYTVPQEHMPMRVRVSKDYPAGEIHVDPNRFYLYLTEGDGQALRYVVGVGRDALYEDGTFTVGRKAEWPTWTPTPDMIERDPASYAQYEDGMPGGPDNPLGARALYLYNDAGYDTALRIHGTPQPWTVASAISNGCVRLVNSHVVHLYERVAEDTKVVLHPKMAPTA